MKKIINILSGFLTGAVNIIIGSGGGIIATEALKYNNISAQNAHATAVSVMLPLTVISALLYLNKNAVQLTDTYIYILPGIAGSVAGAFILPKIPKKYLSGAFSVFIIYAGLRMLFK